MSPSRFTASVRSRSYVLSATTLLLMMTAGDLTRVASAEDTYWQPTTAGLALWLDADRVNELRSRDALERLETGTPLDRWPDLSDHHRDMSQSSEEQQPKLMQLGDSWFVRFDGEDDCLRYLSDPVSLSAATIWMVVAPHSNPGDFRGMFAANEAGQRDYESGINIDLGPGPTRRFGQLNVEGRGFGGAANLRTDECDFGTLHLIELKVDPESKTVALWIDGKPEGTRPLKPGPISLQQLTLGGRMYTNGPGEQLVRGHTAVDIAEVLVYSRTLDEQESKAIRDHLLAKHAALAEAIPKSLPVTFKLASPWSRLRIRPRFRCSCLDFG